MNTGKRALSRIILLSMLLISVLCSCEKEKKDEMERLTFLGNYLHCNRLEAGDRFGFCLSYIYQGETPEVSFVRFDSGTANKLLVSAEDDTLNSLKEKDYRGYKIGTIGFSFDISGLKPGERFEIYSVILSVDGKEQTADIEDGIILTKQDPDTEVYRTESVYFTTVPFNMHSHGMAFDNAPFYYRADQDIVVEGFDFSGFLEIADSEVYIDGKSMGKLDDVLPLAVKAGQNFGWEVSGNYGEHDVFSDFYVDCQMRYSGPEGSRILQTPMVTEAIMSYDDFTAFIDHMLGGE